MKEETKATIIGWIIIASAIVAVISVLFITIWY